MINVDTIGQVSVLGYNFREQHDPGLILRFFRPSVGVGGLREGLVKS